MSDNHKKKEFDPVWLAIAIACFCTGAFWWAGVALIVLNAKGKLPPLVDKFRRQAEKTVESPKPPVMSRAEKKSEKKREKKRKNIGLPEIITGGCLGGVGALVLISTFWEIVQVLFWGVWDTSWLLYYAEDGFWGLLFLAAGAIVAGVGISKRRKHRLFERYQAMIGDYGAVSIHAMADALGIRYEKACRQLQEMIDGGWLPQGAYIDRAKGRLMLDGSGLEYDEQPEQTAEKTITEEEKILRQIRADNDLIDNEEISRKIDRIEELTRRIFAYLREKPQKAGELRSFLNYYLPQTLKILETYARLEAQDVDGANITAAKIRIEGVMDKLVESYERQLDKLFEGDVIDITTDIEVMEKMLARDGLTADALTKQ